MKRVRFAGPDPGAPAWRRRSQPPWALLGPALVALAVVGLLFVMSGRLAERGDSVVVYTSQDQVYAEAILKAFEARHGIRVRAIFDSEAVKTVGLANRLLAERDHPQCDVFWNNEELRTRQLAARGVLADTPPWATLGHRTRRIVVNTNRFHIAEAPQSILELTNTAWRGKIALAYPLFGTTATHFLALRQHWGEAAWRSWCQALEANHPLVVDGNSVVVRLVGRGDAILGLTDSDDIAAGQREGYPIVSLPAGRETLRIPNTVAIVRGAPNPAGAQLLQEFLCEPGTVARLIEANALESYSVPAADDLGLRPDWASLLASLEADTAFLKQVFLR